MRIGEFAQITGISKDTIRYYEKMDLLHPKIMNNYRQYTKDDIEIIEIILKLKQTGFSLQEIKILFNWSQTVNQNKKLTTDEIRNVLQIKEVFQKKYEQIVQKENHMKQIKAVLLKADKKISDLLEKNNG